MHYLNVDDYLQRTNVVTLAAVVRCAVFLFLYNILYYFKLKTYLPNQSINLISFFLSIFFNR